MYSVSSSSAHSVVPPPPAPSASLSAKDSPAPAGGDISPLAGALRRVSNEDSPPRIRLEDVPEPYRAHFAFLRTIDSIPSAHLLDRVLTLESKRFASLLKGSGAIKALMQTSQSSYAAAHCLLEHRTEWPTYRNALYKSVLRGDYRAYSECRLGFFKEVGDSFSTETAEPTWPRTYLEVNGAACTLQSPKGHLHARFLAQAEQISLAWSGQRKVIRFGDRRHLARCGIGIPDRWVYTRSGVLDPKMNPVYASSRFQPVALSPDEKTVFCILEKVNGPPLILKIQEECNEQIAMPPELQSETGHICSMICNAANTLFVYCGRRDAQQLHILENGEWRRLALYRAGPDGESIVDNRSFYVSNVSSKGDVLLTPHDVDDTPILIKLASHACDREGCRDEEDAGGPLQWWRLPRVGTPCNYLEPCIFAFSPDGEYLAISSRNSWSMIFRQMKACVLHLKGLSPKSIRIGRELGPAGRYNFGCQITLQGPGWSSLPNFGNQNDRMLAFSGDNLNLTRAIHDPDTNTITSYTAWMPPRIALKPLFDPLVKIIDKEIDRLNKESEAARKAKASTDL